MRCDEPDGPPRSDSVSRPSRELLLAIVRAAEDSVQASSVEVLIAFDRCGREVLRKQGMHDSVLMTPAEVLLIHGAIVTHNHPHGWTFPPEDPRHQGNSFSLQDVSLAMVAQVAEMRVVTPRWRYVLRPGCEQVWSEDFFQQVVAPAYRLVDRQVRSDFMAAVRAGRMTIEQVIAEHFHEVWMRVAARTGVHYDRESS